MQCTVYARYEQCERCDQGYRVASRAVHSFFYIRAVYRELKAGYPEVNAPVGGKLNEKWKHKRLLAAVLLFAGLVTSAAPALAQAKATRPRACRKSAIWLLTSR